MSDHTALQDQLAPIWAMALGVDTVRGNDNFFALGGHSLLAVKMIGTIQEKLLPHGDIALSDLIDNPTLESFARRLAERAMGGEETGVI